ncbi:hemerythrin domain-containing protein [Nonomuraea jabiensis]|uniref:hemerythrin domain-containing protein n=1 Tax=Nonomuraea jabiensis TaxID=882448 RepID=UPI0036746F23
MNSQPAVLGRIRAHHDRLGRTISGHAGAIARSIDQGRSPAAEQAAMAAFCADELLPHAAAEEKTFYRTAAELPATKLLVQAMQDEHAILKRLAGDLGAATAPGEVVSASSALDVLFGTHLRKENDILLPALAEHGIDLAALLGDTHEILGEPTTETGHGHGGTG